MSKYRTAAEYKTMVRNMPTREIEGLAETLNQSITLNKMDQVIRDILNAEIEHRILQWEAQ